MVAKSSAEAKYQAMALATCELQKLKLGKDGQMTLVCDNQATLHIASNLMTKHIEVDCHFIREKIVL